VSDLDDLQAWMQGCILAPDRGQLPSIRERILPSATLGPEARFAIYQRGYIARLLQCMEGQFKALRHTLGSDLFADFAAEYLRACPSRSPTLSDLGARFADHLQTTRPDAEGEREAWVDFMIELARFEWALYLEFDAAGHEGTSLATAAAPDDSLRPQPSLGVHRYDFPVDAYYHEVAAGADPPVPAAGEVHLAMLRREFRIGTFRLTVPQRDFLARMLEGKCVAAALAETAAAHNVNAAEASEAWGRWRGKWLEQGFFVGD